MYMVYMGESGNTGSSLNDPNQLHHVYAGLLIHENQYVAVNGEFNALCRRHFGSSLGGADTPSELKPADIYQGRGHFKSWSPEKRAELIQDCLNVLVRRETPVIVSYVDKTQWAAARNNGSEAAADWHTRRKPSSPNSSLPSICSLMRRPWPTWTRNTLWTPPANQGLYPGGGGDRQVDKAGIHGPVHSLGSGNTHAGGAGKLLLCRRGESVCTQLANICAYFVRRWLQNPAGSHGYFEALRDGRVIQVIYPVQF